MRVDAESIRDRNYRVLTYLALVHQRHAAVSENRINNRILIIEILGRRRIRVRSIKINESEEKLGDRSIDESRFCEANGKKKKKKKTREYAKYKRT